MMDNFQFEYHQYTDLAFHRRGVIINQNNYA